MIEIPDNINRIMNLLNKEEFDYGQAGKLIQNIPVLLGDFLATANPAGFRRGVKITNINTSLPQLGRRTVHAILYM